MSDPGSSGRSNASRCKQFVAWTQTHHPEVAQRIIGVLTVDEHHLTEG